MWFCVFSVSANYTKLYGFKLLAAMIMGRAENKFKFNFVFCVCLLNKTTW